MWIQCWGIGRNMKYGRIYFDGFERMMDLQADRGFDPKGSFDTQCPRISRANILTR